MEAGWLVTEDESVTEAPQELSQVLGWLLLLVLVKVKLYCAHWDHTSETQTEQEFSVLAFLPVLWYGWPEQGHLRRGISRYSNSS